MNAKVRVVSSLALALATLAYNVTAADSLERKKTLVGQIIAYRPAEMLRQVASSVLNKESFLFAVDGTATEIETRMIKVVYEHFGYSDLGQPVLSNSPLMRLRVRRNPACDESYHSFVVSSPTMPDQSGGGSTEALVFVAKYRDIKISPAQLLRCYALQKGGFQIESPVR